MIVTITQEELQEAQRIISAGMIPTLHSNLEYFMRQVPSTQDLLDGLGQTYEAMRNILATGTSQEFNNAQGGTTLVNPNNAIEEAAIAAIYTAMTIYRARNENLQNMLGANMTSLFQLVSDVYPRTIHLPDMEEDEEDLVEHPEDFESLPDEAYDDEEIPERPTDFDNEDEEDPFEDFSDEELELLLDDELDEVEPDVDTDEAEEKARERERIARELLASFVTLEDDGSDKVDEKFNKRENDPEYYEDIRRPHDWQQNLSIDRNFRVGLKINKEDSVELVGWNNEE